MKTRLLTTMMMVLLVVIAFGCKKKVKKDKASMESRLTERIKLYQTSLIEDEPEKMWEIAIESTADSAKEKKANYIGLIRQSNHMASYHEVKFEIASLEIRGDKAKVKMEYFIKPSEDGEVSRAGMYDFWQFKDDDWYFVIGGRDHLTKLKGWW